MLYIANETHSSFASAAMGEETSRSNASGMPPLASPPPGKATKGNLQMAQGKPRRLECLSTQMAPEASIPN
jgi:hypothetical protein